MSTTSGRTTAETKSPVGSEKVANNHFSDAVKSNNPNNSDDFVLVTLAGLMWRKEFFLVPADKITMEVRRLIGNPAMAGCTPEKWQAVLHLLQPYNSKYEARFDSIVDKLYGCL